ncbi:MAG: hypothetical protein IPJ36_17380 [Simplicispira sp.]|nr:hypothetical protein [Simplicispira sp.]
MKSDGPPPISTTSTSDSRVMRRSGVQRGGHGLKLERHLLETRRQRRLAQRLSAKPVVPACVTIHKCTGRPITIRFPYAPNEWRDFCASMRKNRPMMS